MKRKIVPVLPCNFCGKDFSGSGVRMRGTAHFGTKVLNLNGRWCSVECMVRNIEQRKKEPTP